LLENAARSFFLLVNLFEAGRREQMSLKFDSLRVKELKKSIFKMYKRRSEQQQRAKVIGCN
jgi:poly(A) polymerase Pap1